MRRAIASIDDQAWVRVEYSQAILDPDTGELVSAAEVAEIPYTAFTSHRTAIVGRLIVRRVPERNRDKLAAANQEGLFEVWRYHAIFTTNPAPMDQAESQHRGHAVIEQAIADLKASALAHLPSSRFTANAAWLVAATIAFNLTRAIGVTAGGKRPRRGRDRAGPDHQRACPSLPLRAASTAAPTRTLALGHALAGALDVLVQHLTATHSPNDPTNLEKPEPTSTTRLLDFGRGVVR